MEPKAQWAMMVLKAFKESKAHKELQEHKVQ
jgi:hypothetical protein